MKAVTALCATGSATVPALAAGRVSRQRRHVENEEIQMYLSKLKELVPFMPRNRRLSKLEVIEYVIDYICELQYALETQPCVGGSGGSSPRQPLGVLAPNTIPGNVCSSQDHSCTTPVHLEKLPPPDSRPVSC